MPNQKIVQTKKIIANRKPNKPKRKGLRIPIRVQFTFFVVMTIGAIMVLTTMLTYNQQQKSLRAEMVKRGATIARSLASSAAEAVLNDLVCAALIHETMPRNKAELPSVDLQSIIRSLINDISGRSDAFSQKISHNAGVVEILMVDSNGMIVAHNDIQQVSRLYQPPAGTKPYQGETMLVQPYVKGDERRFDIAVPILVNRLGKLGGKRIGVVHLGMSQMLVDQTVKQAAIKLLVVTGLMLLLGTLAAIFLAHFMTQPIKNLVSGVLAIAGGDLNQEIKVGRNDELGELTDAFNEMAQSLREKEQIEGAFCTYVSSQVMEEVLKDPGKLALGGARKHASMLFTDIRGFTSMSETMQPEDVVSVINEYLSIQTEIVLRNGGMLDKFVGDCVMAVYGVPLPKTDDALRAVTTAVEIQEAVKELNEKRKESGLITVTIGVGVNTGEVVSGNMGSAQKMDYTVIGDAVNLAARLESIAEGGSVLISETTFQEVKEHILAEKLSPISVKGKREQVSVYRVKSMRL